MHRAPPAVDAYFAALNAEDWTALGDVWADACELRAVGTRPRRGREEVMSYFRPLFEPWHEHADRPTRLIVSGDAVVVEVEFTGVSRAGHRVVFDAVDIFDLDNGAIAKLSTWYDLDWVRRQL